MKVFLIYEESEWVGDESSGTSDNIVGFAESEDLAETICAKLNEKHSHDLLHTTFFYEEVAELTSSQEDLESI